jgi:hypothetical protein
MSNGGFSKGGSFFVGFLLGLLAAALAGFLSARYILRHPQQVMARVAMPRVNQMVQRTMSSAPREYIGEKQDDIGTTAHALARAYSEGRVTPEDMQAIGGRLFAMMADQQITPKEIDEVLRMIHKYAGSPDSSAAAPASGGMN